MNKLRLIAAVVIAGAFVMLSTGAAQAYPDTNGVTITATSPLIGGKVTHFTAHADGPCETMTVTYVDGKAATETSTRTANNVDTLSGSYVTKVVGHTTTTHMTVTCTYDDNCPPGYVGGPSAGSTGNCPVVGPADPSSNAVTPASTHTASATAKVILLTKGGGGGDNNGSLPNTGGSNLWIFVVGAVLVLGGIVAIVASRRRSIR